MSMSAQVSVGGALAVFVAGVLSFFSPCVAPLVPGYIGYLSGSVIAAGETDKVERASSRNIRRVCLIFVAGFSCAFVALGLLSASFGRVLVAYQPVLEAVAGIVMIVMGAFLLNLVPRGFAHLLLRERRVPAPARVVERLGGLAPFALGVVFAAGWTPCIGPVLAAILVYVGATANRGQGAFLLAFYSLGFALPFLAVGLGWAGGLRALGWVRRHGDRVSPVSGVTLVIVGLLYLTGQVSVFASWAQQFAAPVR